VRSVAIASVSVCSGEARVIATPRDGGNHGPLSTMPACGRHAGKVPAVR
jgi:hypothetical protein